MRPSKSPHLHGIIADVKIFEEAAWSPSCSYPYSFLRSQNYVTFSESEQILVSVACVTKEKP